MTRNIGTIDRTLRIIAGLILLALIFVGPQSYWGLVGLVPLVTGLAGWCPLYAIFRINTCGAKSA